MPAAGPQGPQRGQGGQGRQGGQGGSSQPGGIYHYVPDDNDTFRNHCRRRPASFELYLTLVRDRSRKRPPSLLQITSWSFSLCFNSRERPLKHSDTY